MPTYEYKCRKCGYQFEEFQSITEKPLKTCPKKECNGRVYRIISPGAGFLFKGSGFYETDYRSESYKKAAAAEKETSASSSSEKSKTESKSDATKSPSEKSSGAASSSSKKDSKK
jgi:putative FmdB family regulatory protein